MKAIVLSDLHLDHWGRDGNAPLITLLTDVIVEEKIDCFLCAGDMCEMRYSSEWYAFLGAIPKIPFFYVAGNHDFYCVDLGNALQGRCILHQLNDVYPNFHFLNNTSVTFQGWVIIGSSLYTDFNLYGNSPLEVIDPKYKQILDFSVVGYLGRPLLPTDYAILNGQARTYLKDAVEKNAGKKIIVMTHWGPSGKLIDETYAGDSRNSYFVTGCDELFYLDNQPNYWVFGHTHTPVRHQLNQTKFICNPRGYPSENNLLVKRNFVVDFGCATS